MKIERRKNAVKGTFFGFVFRFVQIVFPFVLRTIMIRTLGAEYLGLNSLFSAILQVLNLTELGVSSALVFSMYRPIVDNDTEKICQLMNLYRKYYRIIGLIILGIGALLIPFIRFFIKGSVPSDINVYILYIMHLSATVLSYWLFGYRNSLFSAHQRTDVINIINICVYVILYSLQAYILIAIRNYYIYLSLIISAQILINLITAFFSKRFYPNYEPRGSLSAEERKIINKKVRDLFTSKVGTVLNNSADSIVISAFLGLKVLTTYQNYYYIISSIMAIFTIFFNACVAGIGNSLIVNSKEKNRQLLYNINHIVFMAINFCCACFLSICQPFIKVWVGDEFELHFSFIILFTIYLFVEEAPRTLVAFKDAGGMWKHDRFRPLVCACVNLTLNLILTPVIGLYGIILSTIIALLFVAYPWLIININNRLINIGIKKYVLRIVVYILVIVLGTGLSYWINSFVVFDSIYLTIILRFLISFIVSNIIFIVVFWKTNENKYVMSYLFSLRKKFCSR